MTKYGIPILIAGLIMFGLNFGDASNYEKRTKEGIAVTARVVSTERKARRRGFDYNVVLAYTVTKSSHEVTKEVPLQLFKTLAPRNTLPIAVSKENPESLTIIHPSIPADMRGHMKFGGAIAAAGLVLIVIGCLGKKKEPEVAADSE